MEDLPETNGVEADNHRREAVGDILRGSVLAVLILIALYFLFSTYLPGFGHKADLSTPSGSAEEFIRLLTSHQFEKAGEQLTSQLSQKVGSDELHILFNHLELQNHWMLDLKVDTVSIEGDNAITVIHLVSNKGTRQEVKLPLHKEGSVWRIASIEPLWSLVEQITHPDLVTY